MNRLKKNQIGPFCSFCPPRTSRAKYVQTGWLGNFACEEHKHKLAQLETNQNNEQELTEADYQTWVNL